MSDNTVTHGSASADNAPTSTFAKSSSGAGFFELEYVLNIIRRWWWLIGLATAMIIAIAVIILLRTEPVYRSGVTLEVRQSERNLTNVSEVEEVSVNQNFVSTQIELLKSNRLAEKVIDQLQLTSDTYFFDAADESWQTLSQADKRRRILGRFNNSRTVSPVGLSLLIKINFEHTKPQRAALIANTIADVYINEGVAKKVNANAFARDFLQKGLEDVRITLEQAERKFAQYAVDNEIILTDSGSGTGEGLSALETASLIALNKELTRVRIDRAAAQTAFDRAQGSNFTEAILESEAIDNIKARLRSLRGEYSENLAIFKPGYPAMIELQKQIDSLEAELLEQTNLILFSRTESLGEEYERNLALEHNLIQQISRLKTQVSEARETGIEYNILRRQVETGRAQYQALLQRLGEVSFSTDDRADLVQIADRARPTTVPFKPNRGRTIALAAFLGALLGFGIAYLLEFFDDRVKLPEHIRTKLGTTILGVIPTSDVDDRIASLSDSRSELAEAYASLRTNLQFSGPGGGPRVIQITSSRSGEGKSLTSAGLSMRFAGLGKRTLLIDADLRRPTFKSSVPGARGLSDVLSDNGDLLSSIQGTNSENLDMLPAGHIVPNPSELLSSDRLSALLAAAREEYDYVIIDSPPVLGLADAPALGARVEGLVMVVQAGVLRTASVRSALERLQNSGTKIMGAILTQYVQPSGGYGSYYNYSYGSDSVNYGEKSGSKKTRKEAEEMEDRKIVLSG